MSGNATPNPGKSVAFCSPDRAEEGRVRIIGDEIITVNDAESNDQRRLSLPDSEADSSKEEKVPFPGLYPVVFIRLKQTTRPRIWCLRMIENPWFERISMIVIFMNCVTLGLYEPCEHKNSNHCDTQKCAALEICDHFVFAFFAIEMLIKMIAMGVWGKLGYLGDKWNRLDAAIVFFGIVEYAVQMEGSINFTAIRTIRVLRPLRAINRVASMRILVMLLLDTLPMLGNVLLLCSFVFFIFGIVAVQLWAGLLRQRCFLDPDIFLVSGTNVSLNGTSKLLTLSPYYNKNDEEEAICSQPSLAGAFKCSDRKVVPHYNVDNITCNQDVLSYYGNSSQDIIIDNIVNQTCVDWNQYYNDCRVDGGNPFQGAINFDNIMYAWVAIFQVISLEGWVDIMYYVMDAHSFYSFIYFIMLIVIGSFFMINLCLVVIATQFSETKQREQKLIEEQRMRFKSNDSTLASYSPPGNTYEELIKYISHVYRKNKRKLLRWWQLWKQNREEKKKQKSSIRRSSPGGKSTKGGKKGKSIHLHHHHHHHHHHYHIAPAGGSSGGILLDSGGEPVLNVDVELQPPRSPTLSPSPLMITDGRTDPIDVTAAKSHLRVPFSSLTDVTSVHSFAGSVTPERCDPHRPERRRSGEVLLESSGRIFFKSGPIHTNESRSDYLSGTSSPQHFGAYVTSNLNCPCSGYDVTGPESFESEAEDAVDGFSRSSKGRKNCCIRCCQVTRFNISSAWSELSEGMKKIVDSRYYQHCIMAAILVNTLSMGIEHHNQSQTLTDILEISNIVFTTIFGLEMISKLIAYGIPGYIVNLYNVFDAGIVIISVCEIAADTSSAGNGGLSVLRTFRLLRVLKLVRFMPALRRQLVVLMKTMDNVATFMMLLTLFIFIFSILGMHLFGCKFCWKNKYGETECDRKNFDSLLWACVTVFQILTQEDWNVVLYNGMIAIGPFGAIYFLTLMIIGNYVLFNLLVAILVEGFQAHCYSENDQKERRLSAKRKSEIEGAGSIIAQKYTEKIARSLGLQTPFSPRTSMKSHHDLCDDDVTEELNSEDSDYFGDAEVVQAAPIITVTGDNETIKRTVSGGAVYYSVPIITHTSATPTNSPSPNGSPSISRFRLDDYDAVIEKGKQSNPSEPNSPKSGVKEQRRTSETPSKLSLTLPFNSKFPTHQRSPSSESRRSSTSSTFSRTGSWKIKRTKPVPLDQESLISNEFDQEDELDCNDVSSLKDVSITYDDPNSVITPYHQTSLVTLKQPSFTDEIGGITNDVEMQIEEMDRVSADLRSTSCCHNLLSNRFIHERRDWPLYTIPPTSIFRKSITKMVGSKWFDNIILLFIFANCITIAMEKPSIDPDSTVRRTLDILNYIFTVVFTIEMMLKVIAYGFCVGPHTYLKSGWNVLDFLLVVTSLIDVIMTLASSYNSKVLGMLRVFRLLRALRPLRVISRAPGLKLVVQTLISSLKPIGNIVLICCAFFIIFGILGVQIFKGKFFHCIGDDVRNVTGRTACDEAAYIWTNHRYNFDHLGQALMSLFVLSSKDGWVEIMYNGIDAVGVDKQPIVNYNPGVLLFFISFLLIVGFFVINMFVGVVVENFHRCREEHEQQEIKRKLEAKKRKEEKLRRKNELRQLGGDARRNTLRRRTCSRVRYGVNGVTGRFRLVWKRIADYWKTKTSTDNFYENYGPFRRKIYNICTSKYFELGVSAVIGINIITMAVEHYNQPEELDIALKYANYVFTAVFVVEAILKLVALGFFGYFRDIWNHMDMAIVILSIVGIVIEDAASSDSKLPINPTIVRFMRVLRIARVLKLLKVSKGIRSLLETVFRALPQVGNLGLLFLLLFFIYAALGVELFGTIQCDEEEFQCEGLGRHATFENFGIALLTLFRISTGDNWNGIMKDTLRTTCDDAPECTVNCCVSPIISPIYFVTFVMMAQFVLVNVVIAVLMKQLEDSRADESEDSDDDVFESEDDVDDQDAVGDDPMLLLCNREDVATSEEIVITADVTDTSSLSVTLLVTDNSQKTEQTDEAEVEEKQAHKNIEIINTETPLKEAQIVESAPSKEATKQKQNNQESSQPSVFVILPPPSSNSLQVSGCKSTSASPARIPRHGTLPARTKSLNLPGSEQEDCLSEFRGISHLPLQPRNSDPTRKSPSNLSTDTPKQSSNRRIKRHFSDNPLLLRPDDQSVHHHHHYHVSSDTLSNSATNILVSNPKLSLESKITDYTSVFEPLSKSANNVSYVNSSINPAQTKNNDLLPSLPIPLMPNSAWQSLSKSANNVSSLPTNANHLESKDLCTSNLLNPSSNSVSQGLSKSTSSLSSGANPNLISLESPKIESSPSLPNPILPQPALQTSPKTTNGISSTNLNCATTHTVDPDKKPTILSPLKPNVSVLKPLSISTDTDSNLKPNGLTTAATLIERNTIVLPVKPKSQLDEISQPTSNGNCHFAKPTFISSKMPKLVSTLSNLPKSVSNESNELNKVIDCSPTPIQSENESLPKSKKDEGENSNEQNANQKDATKRDSTPKKSISKTNHDKKVISSKEKWIEFSDENGS